MTWAVSGTHGTGAQETAKAMLAYLETGQGPFPDDYLANFNELLKRAQSPALPRYTPLKLTIAELSSSP